MAETLVSPFTQTSAECKYFGLKDGQPIFECSETGALFFDRSKLKDYTYQDYYEYLPHFDAKRVHWELDIRRNNIRSQLNEAQLLIGRDSEKVYTHLDIGAGPGYCVKIAKELGLDSVGIELAEKAILHGQNWYGVEYSSLDAIQDESIDIITCHHVLEHIPNVYDFVSAMKVKLRRNGLLILHVPHQQPLTFLLRDYLNRSKNSERVCSLYSNIHLSGFTVPSLQKVIEIHGLTTLKCVSRGMWSKYYDPFFLRNYLQSGSYGTIARKALRHALENLGQIFDMNDWVIGYFKKT